MSNYSHSADVVQNTGNRKAFVNKVFAGFGIAVLISAIGAYLGVVLFQMYPEVMVSPVMIWGSFIATLALVMTRGMWHEIVPLNFVMFTLLALLFGFITTPLLLYAGMVGGGLLIAKALVTTTCVFSAAAIMGWITNKDLSSWGPMLGISVFAIFIVSIINALFLHSSITSTVIDIACVGIFTIFTAYDIQNIKERYPDNLYLIASLELFLDFINLFRAILSLLLSFNRD